MTPQQAEFLLQEVYLPQIHNEHKTTRRVIAAIPANNCDWKPDPKSKSALDLAWHIASSECFFMNGVTEGKFNPGSGEKPANVKTPADVLAWYDENFAKAVGGLSKTKGDQLVTPIDFFGMFNFPGVAYVGLMCSHSVHHRGQVSSYLRPMGGKVPSIYGPSGDEEIPMPARASS